MLYIHVSCSDFGPGDAEGREGFPKGPPRGLQGKSQTISKVFINDRFYSVAVSFLFYRVLKLFEINLERPGKRFV